MACTHQCSWLIATSLPRHGWAHDESCQLGALCSGELDGITWILVKELDSRYDTKATKESVESREVFCHFSRLLLKESPVTGHEGVGHIRPAMKEPVLPTNYTAISSTQTLVKGTVNP